MAAWKHSRQQLRLRLAWLRVFGDDARAIQRTRTALDALGWRRRSAARQSPGSTADRHPGCTARDARACAVIASAHRATGSDPSANSDTGAIPDA